MEHTGGVIEAAAVLLMNFIQVKNLKDLILQNSEVWKVFVLQQLILMVFQLNIGIAHGLGNARKLLDDVRAGKSQFHAIEIMACPGGCIGGGGQPLHHGNSEIIKARAAAIYTEDRKKPLRKSHENPFIIKLYDEFLGKPGSEKAHHLLHTHYFDKKKKIIIKK